MQPSEIVFFPEPQKVEAAQKRTPLAAQPLSVAIAEKAGDVERYAAALLRDDLQRIFRQMPELHPGARPAEASIAIGAPATYPELADTLTPDERRAFDALPDAEACLLLATRGDNGEELRVRIIGRDPAGALYGVYTLLQALRRDGNHLVLPDPLRIEDYPVMRTRGFPWYVADADGLDRMSRARMNAMTFKNFFSVFGPPHRPFSEKIDPAAFDQMREAHRRGIQMIGGTAQRWVERYWASDPQRHKGKAFLTSNPDAVAVMRDLFDQLGAAGIDGYVFMLDDIVPDPRFSIEELGREHVAWTRLMKEVAVRHGIRRLLMCPTHYWANWKPEYYRGFKEADDLDDVGMIFCPFDRRDVERVLEAGLRNYEWWQNGVWPLGQGEWTRPGFKDLLGGFYHVHWGWYGAIEPTPDMLGSLRTLHERTLDAWGNTGAWNTWGAYLWNPARYDPADFERREAEVSWGEGAAVPYLEVVNHLRQWPPRFAAADTPSTEEKETREQQFAQSTRAAHDALDRLQDTLDADERPGAWPPEKQRHEWYQLYHDLRKLGRKGYDPAIRRRPTPEGGPVEVTLGVARGGVEIRYTLDGSEPRPESPLYESPLRLERSAIVTAAVFAGEQALGHAVAQVAKHDATGCTVTFADPPSPQYAGGGPGDLTDGNRGSRNWHAGGWLGWDSRDLEATVDLGRTIEIGELHAGFLQDAASEIYLPAQVDFAISGDGRNFEIVEESDNTIPATDPGVMIQDFGARLAAGRRGRYVRVRARNLANHPRWHRGEGYVAWMFVDEILVNPVTE